MPGTATLAWTASATWPLEKTTRSSVREVPRDDAQWPD